MQNKCKKKLTLFILRRTSLADPRADAEAAAAVVETVPSSLL
jgi:hypothetical protein